METVDPSGPISVIQSPTPVLSTRMRREPIGARSSTCGVPHVHLFGRELTTPVHQDRPVPPSSSTQTQPLLRPRDGSTSGDRLGVRLRRLRPPPPSSNRCGDCSDPDAHARRGNARPQQAVAPRVGLAVVAVAEQPTPRRSPCPPGQPGRREAADGPPNPTVLRTPAERAKRASRSRVLHVLSRKPLGSVLGGDGNSNSLGVRTQRERELSCSMVRGAGAGRRLRRP